MRGGENGAVKRVGALGGNDREATVYDTTGRTVYQGFERAIALDRSGLYIIEIDGRRMKVVL